MTKAMELVAKEAAAKAKPSLYVAHQAMAGRIEFSQIPETCAALGKILESVK